MFFHESVGRRVVFAVLFITAGSILLTLDAGGGWGISVGALGILGTATLWGFDNNLTRKIAARDALTIGWVKGLVSGVVSLVLALVLHNTFPDLVVVLAALAVGAVSYGVALALFIMALRRLGAARTSAIFGTAPFWGAVAAFIIFREIQWIVFISLPLMVVGMYILLGERSE
jgi:drug/metabolite transporter (DMT)-like permease